jgi:superfamily I DNA/RNA helicase
MEPEWLSLITDAVSPQTEALLVLYDGAQSIYKRKRFSLKSVGVKAQGRTTIFRLNYRCTAEILQFAYDYARNVLAPHEDDEDHVPLLLPETAGRHGPVPIVQLVRDRRSEIEYIIGRFRVLRGAGHRWRDMAVLERKSIACESFAAALREAGIPVTTRAAYRPENDAVPVITYHSSKGLEFPIVAIPALPMAEQPMPPSKDEIRLLYVAMTRAMEHLLLTSLATAGPVLSR